MRAGALTVRALDVNMSLHHARGKEEIFHFDSGLMLYFVQTFELHLLDIARGSVMHGRGPNPYYSGVIIIREHLRVEYEVRLIPVSLPGVMQNT
jgi:hypothetical protein